MRKVSVVITARASYCRVKAMLDAIAAHPKLTLQLIVFFDPGQEEVTTLRHWIERDQFSEVIWIGMDMQENDLESAAARTSAALAKLPGVFRKLGPDIVVTIADRHETIATAISASYMNIPLAHLQGGESTGNIDDKVRNAVTQLADLHFVATQNAYDRIVNMGEDPARVHLVGCPSIDLAKQISDGCRSEHSKQFDLPYTSDKFLIIMQHPVTTEFGETKKQILQTLEAVRLLNLPAFWFQPNYDPGHRDLLNTMTDFLEKHSAMQVQLVKDLPPAAFLTLLDRCACLIGNSSAGIREGSFLGTPVVNIGSRQAGRERARNVLDVCYEMPAIVAATLKQLETGKYPSSDLYGRGDAGLRIAEILAECSLTITKKSIV